MDEMDGMDHMDKQMNGEWGISRLKYIWNQFPFNACF